MKGEPEYKDLGREYICSSLLGLSAKEASAGVSNNMAYNIGC